MQTSFIGVDVWTSLYTDPKTGDTVKSSSRYRSLRAAIAATVIALSCAASWAARDFTPQAGTWVITEELDGKPGRGLAIDVQGNTFFMQVFGYEKNGDATFYTATGQMEGNTVTAPLMQYQGGRSFGDDARNAVELGSPGNVTVSFANGLQGAIQFPGEPERAIKRFQMQSPDFASRYWDERFSRQFLVTVLDANLQPLQSVSMSLMGSKRQNIWGLMMTRLGENSRQTFHCEQLVERDTFHCTSDEAQPAGYEGFGFQSIRFTIANIDVAGVIDDGVQTRRMMGITTSGGTGTAITGCTFYGDLYVGDARNCGPALTPSSGTWVVKDELSGKPGRGIALDVQNGMVMTQVFNYQLNGAPTFHMGSAQYQGHEAQLTLHQYQGGRALGGMPTSAQLLDTAGELKMRFTLPEPWQASADRVEASIQFPRETEKRMVRMALETGVTSAQGLLGQWWLRFSFKNKFPVHQLVMLTQIRGDEAWNEDGSIRCARTNPQVPSRAECTWQKDGTSSWGYMFQEPGNRSMYVLQC
ncbi:hypothetical protein ACFIQG_16210 [Comamonas odontotermitis]|uniref:hypothetical protein n=1 Tax=Comamonas odontotermitis TaxID=379895 RepID=UPI00366DF474